MNKSVLSNEEYMKDLGEKKVWKTVKTNSKAKKKISSTQIGQQLLFDEALKISPDVKDWIFNKAARAYKKELTTYFQDEEFLIQKIVETMLLLSGDIEGILPDSEETVSRHKKIATINKRVLTNLSFNNAWRFVEIIVD